MFGNLLLSSATELGFWEKLSEWYHSSLLYELITYFHERYFTIEFGTYENFTVSSSAATTIRSIVPALAIALIIFALVTASIRVNTGKFVRRLLREESFTPDRAKTLMELDFFRNARVRKELSRGSNLRMVVRCVHENGTETMVGSMLGTVTNGVKSNAEINNKKESDSTENQSTGSKKTLHVPQKIDFLTARFYIPEELKHRADVRFDRSGSGWGQAIATIAISVAVAALLCWLLPDILQLADNIISLASPG